MRRRLWLLVVGAYVVCLLAVLATVPLWAP
jgi:hypothetical protein